MRQICRRPSFPLGKLFQSLSAVKVEAQSDLASYGKSAGKKAPSPPKGSGKKGVVCTVAKFCVPGSKSTSKEQLKLNCLLH